MAKKKTPKKRGIKTSQRKVSKKKVTKKKTTRRFPIKKKSVEKKQITKTSHQRPLKKSPLVKKKRRIIINLIGFLVVLILSIVLYSITGNYVSEIIFFTLIILSLVICIALFLALVSVLLARNSKKR
jgi:magnesium-transporting ATPase (P-type)